MYDVADSVLAQKLAQVKGVGQVFVGGGSQPAVRVEGESDLLNKLGHRPGQVRTALNAANATAQGQVSDERRPWRSRTNDQLFKADEYPTADRRLSTTARQCGLGDVADVPDSVEDTRNTGLANGKPAVLMIISGSPAQTSSRPSTASRDCSRSLQARSRRRST